MYRTLRDLNASRTAVGFGSRRCSGTGSSVRLFALEEEIYFTFEEWLKEALIAGEVTVDISDLRILKTVTLYTKPDTTEGYI